MKRLVAALFAGLCSSVVCGQSFENVPYVYTQSPEAFAYLFSHSQCNTVRAVMLGDSQETCPGGGGSVYIPRLQFEFWSQVGNAPETPWMILGSSYGGGGPYADWLGRGANVAGGVTAGRLSSQQVPPNMNSVKTCLANGANINNNQIYGNLLMLQHDSADIDPNSLIQGAHFYFDASADVYLDVLAATNTSSGEISVRVRPAPNSTPSFFTTPTATFTSSIGLETSTPGILSYRCGPLPMGSGQYLQVELYGTSATKYTDLVSARFVNNDDPIGWSITSLSAGGYRVGTVETNHSQCGPVLSAMDPDVVFICLGANDAPHLTAAQYRDALLDLIDFVRSSTRPDMPFVLMSDPARTGLTTAQQAEWDQFPYAQTEVCDLDPLVCAVNSRRLTHEAGWTPSNVLTYASDGVHYSPEGAILKANLEATALFDEFMIYNCGCNADYNCDGNADQDDVACLINVLAGNPGCECLDPDFNKDGNLDQDDVAALISVIAGGNCP